MATATNPFQTTGYVNAAEPYATALLKTGANLVSQPMPQYTAQAASQYANFVPGLVAAQTPYQVNAAQAMGDLQGYTTPFTQAALKYAQSAGTPINNTPVSSQQINQYMSPYLSNVMDAAVKNINETNAQQQQQLAGNAIAKGAWGGDRAGIAQAQLARQQNLANNATLANILNTGYGTALGEANVQQQQDIASQLYNRQLANATAAQMQNLGSTSQAAQLQQLQSQYNMGAAMQGQHQNELSAAYQQWLNAYQSPYQQANWYANLVSGSPAALGGQTVATIPQPNTVSALGGLATTLAGMNLGGLFGGSTSGSTGAKRGGAIRPGYANGGRPTYAAAGAVPAMSSDPVQAYNDYINASRNRTSLADLNALYANMRNAQRGNATPSAGVAGLNYPVAPKAFFTPETASELAATPKFTPQSIAATPGQSGSSSTANKLAAVGGVAALLSKLFGGGDNKGKGSGETFNKRDSVRGGTKTPEQQDALNEQAETVADKITLLEDDRNKGKITEEEYKAQRADLDKQAADLAAKGAVTEKPDPGESIADRAAVIRQEMGIKPSGVAPVTNQGITEDQKKGLESLKAYEQGQKVTENEGVAPATMVAGGNGLGPLSVMSNQDAAIVAQQLGLANASPQDLKAYGFSDSQVQAITGQAQENASANALNLGEMGMQPSYTPTTGEDPAANQAYQQYINMGFSPQEAQTAVAANTSVAAQKSANVPTMEDYQKSLSTVNDTLNNQYSSQNEALQTQYQNAIAKLGDAPSATVPLTDAQKYVIGIENGTINPQVGAYGYRGYGGVPGQDPAVNSAYKHLQDLANSKNTSLQKAGTDWMNEPNPAYEAWSQNSKAIEDAYNNAKSASEENYQKAQENAQNQINQMYENQGLDLGNAYDFSSQNLQNINNLGSLPTIENIQNYENALPTTWEDYSNYQPQQFGSDMTDFNQPYTDTSQYIPEVNFPQIDVSQFDTGTLDTSSGTTPYVPPPSSSPPSEEERRGGRIHPRHHRALGGPNVPQAGVRPIAMDYGLNTQEYMKQLAQSQMGSGVLPVTSGQEALASTYLLGNQ